MAPEPDGLVLLDGLRRRIDDQTAQARRTQNQVSQLTESIAALVEVQRRRVRRVNLNSFVAYLIFTTLLGTGFYLLYLVRSTDLNDSYARAIRERDAATRRADEATAKVAAREKADQQAWDVYELLEQGKRAEAEAKLAGLGELPLSRTERAVLAARAHETHVVAVDAALKSAVVAFKAGRHGEVIAPLEAALVGEPPGMRAATMQYYLGVAHAKAGDLTKAIGHLQASVAANVDQDDARFQLASALDRSGAYAKARLEYNQFATAHPQSTLAGFAMRRSATLARMRAQPAPGTTGAAPSGSAAPTAAQAAPAKPSPAPSASPPPAAPSTPPAAPPPANPQ
ncbi:MAG: tol-pal system YbgF family protein [Kofleriaceae bacterium]